MIYGELLPGQGLGNQLWLIYAIKKFAEDLDCKYEFFGSQNLKSLEFPHLDLPKANKSHREFVGDTLDEKECLHPLTGENITRFDPTFKERIREGTKIRGYFQSVDYLPKKSLIEKELSLDAPTFEGCTIVLRGGEYRQLSKVFLPKSYYETAINLLRFHVGKDIPIRIVTDDKALAKSWFPSSEIISSGGVKRIPYLPYIHPRKELVTRDFSAIQSSRYLVLSNSSFAWWGAYSNQVTQLVVAPKFWAAFNTSNGYWSQGDSLTPEWTYLDRRGSSFTYEQCLEEVAKHRDSKQ